MIQFQNKRLFFAAFLLFFSVLLTGCASKEEKAIKKLPVSWNVKADEMILEQLGSQMGKENVKVRETVLKSF